MPLSGMRIGSYLIKGKSGLTADFSIVSLGGRAGSFSANINRWRGQLGLEPATKKELSRSIEEINVGSKKIQIVHIEGGDKHILAAIVTHEGAMYFFKMMGASTVVLNEQRRFMAFVRQIHYD